MRFKIGDEVKCDNVRNNAQYGIVTDVCCVKNHKGCLYSYKLSDYEGNYIGGFKESDLKLINPALGVLLRFKVGAFWKFFGLFVAVLIFVFVIIDNNRKEVVQ